jgi:trans-aconitate methyltransferase
VVGVDLDPPMLAEARAKAPELTWVEADLLPVDLGRGSTSWRCPAT